MAKGCMITKVGVAEIVMALALTWLLLTALKKYN